MAELSPAIVQAAEHFGLDAARLRCLGGNSGSSWEAGEQVLRVGRPAVVDTELAAAGRAGLAMPCSPAFPRRPDSGLRLRPPLAPPPRSHLDDPDPRPSCLHTPGTTGMASPHRGMEAGGLRDLPAAPRAWACRFMLRDLARPYAPGDLKYVSRALRQADAAAAKTTS